MNTPSELVQEGQELEVKILRVDPSDRKIGLSRRRLGEAEVWLGEVVVHDIGPTSR